MGRSFTTHKRHPVICLTPQAPTHTHTHPHTHPHTCTHTPLFTPIQVIMALTWGKVEVTGINFACGRSGFKVFDDTIAFVVLARQQHVARVQERKRTFMEHKLQQVWHSGLEMCNVTKRKTKGKKGKRNEPREVITHAHTRAPKTCERSRNLKGFFFHFLLLSSALHSSFVPLLFIALSPARANSNPPPPWSQSEDAACTSAPSSL